MPRGFWARTAALVLCTTCYIRATTATASYIIQLEPGTSITSRDTDTVLQNFHSRASELLDYTLRYEFKDPTSFFGASVDVSDDASINNLLRLPDVKHIWPNLNLYTQETSQSSAFWDVVQDPNAPRSASDEVTLPHITGTSDFRSALRMIGVDKLHDLGIKGKGIKIGIIDNGVDYRHPALGGGFGKGFKIAGGYDFLGPDYTPLIESSKEPGPDPLSKCSRHGTHVAGIIGAQDPPGVGFGIIGVAPEATLYVYRVGNCQNTGQVDIAMQAFLKAGQDGVDVINFSMGIDSYWHEEGSPFTPIFSALHRMGIGIVVANGNKGYLGPFMTCIPAAENSVLAVGSAINTKFHTMYYATDSAGQTVEYASLLPITPATTFNVFLIQSGSDTDDCDIQANFDKAMASFLNVDRIISVMDIKSPCRFDAWRLLRKKGIRRLWVYQEDTLELDDKAYLDGINVNKITSTEAAKIIAGISAQGTNYTLNLSDQTVHDTNQPNGNTVAKSSTIGPSLDLKSSPHFTAPGGGIFSTAPLENGGYAYKDGTSMAAPHVAGAYALIKSVHRSFGPDQIRKLLQNTATPQNVYESLILTTTAQQGAGLVNVHKALHCESEISPSRFSLGDSSSPLPQKITIRNKSRIAKKYVIGHEASSQVDALPNIYKNASYWSLPSLARDNFEWNEINNPFYATPKISIDSITLLPNESTSFTVQITPPQGLDANKLPLYSGYITVQEGENKHFIPYIGVPYRRLDYPLLDTSKIRGTTRFSLPPHGIPSVPYFAYDDDLNSDFQLFNLFEYPQLSFDIVQPSPYVRIDFVPADTPFKPTYYGFDPSNKVNTTSSPLNVSMLDNFAEVQSYGAFATWLGPEIGPLTTRKVTYSESRGYDKFSVFLDRTVALENGTIYKLPDGDYRILLRALKYGTEYMYRNASWYESWLSPVARLGVPLGAI